MKAPTGKELRELGMQEALAHAGDKWMADNFRRLAAFCKVRKNIGNPKFRAEEFREVAIKRDWPMPPSHKCWGAFFSAAAKKGIIKSTRTYEPAQSPATHGHPVLVWLAL